MKSLDEALNERDEAWKIIDLRNQKIEQLQTERDYWEREYKRVMPESRCDHPPEDLRTFVRCEKCGKTL